MAHEKPLILLTNDDGIQSPGLWAAAETLSQLGLVTVVAPRTQQTATSRSMPAHSDWRIQEQETIIGGNTRQTFAIGASPAQAVQYAVLEILPRHPDLIVSGINYGENVGTSITISGTVGAALEGASFAVPSMAVSLQMDREYHLTHSNDIDFGTAAYFTRKFGQKLLEGKLISDVDVLKIDVPADATPETAWRLTRVSRTRYTDFVKPKRSYSSETTRPDYIVKLDLDNLEKDSDVYVLRVAKEVSVAPLSLDLTSRVDFEALATLLDNHAGSG
jgi:5'-nucleotidase